MSYLQTVETRTYEIGEFQALEGALEMLQRNLVVIPINSVSDVLVNAAGRLPCGYTMTTQVMESLAAVVTKEFPRLLDALNVPDPLPWVAYRDLCHVVLEHRWPRIRQLVLYGNRRSRQIEAIGRRTCHKDLQTAYDAARQVGRIQRAELTGRHLRLWITAYYVTLDCSAGYVLEAYEGGLASWQASRAIMTPFGGVAAGDRTRSGVRLTHVEVPERIRVLGTIAWKAGDEVKLSESIQRFLELPLDGILAGALSARYKLSQLLVTKIMRASRRKGQPLNGARLLQAALQLGARPPGCSVFDDPVRRAAYYWLTRRLHGY